MMQSDPFPLLGQRMRELVASNAPEQIPELLRQFLNNWASEGVMVEGLGEYLSRAFPDGPSEVQWVATSLRELVGMMNDRNAIFLTIDALFQGYLRFQGQPLVQESLEGSFGRVVSRLTDFGLTVDMLLEKVSTMAGSDMGQNRVGRTLAGFQLLLSTPLVTDSEAVFRMAGSLLELFSGPRDFTLFQSALKSCFRASSAHISANFVSCLAFQREYLRKCGGWQDLSMYLPNSLDLLESIIRHSMGLQRHLAQLSFATARTCYQEVEESVTRGVLLPISLNLIEFFLSVTPADSNLGVFLKTTKLLKLVLSCPQIYSVVGRKSEELLGRLVRVNYQLRKSVAGEADGLVRTTDKCLRYLFEKLPATRSLLFEIELPEPGFHDFLVEKALDLWPKDTREIQDLFSNHFAKHMAAASLRTQALKMVRLARNNLDCLSVFSVPLFRNLVLFILTNLEVADPADPGEYKENIGLLKAMWKSEHLEYKVGQATDTVLDRFSSFLPPRTPNAISWLRIFVQ